MWKPTVLYWLMAVVLLVSNLFFKKNFIQQMMGQMIDAPKPIWDKVNWVWVAFLIFLGFLNLYVAFNYSENTWVNFKLFGVTSMLFLFMIAHAFVLKNYLVAPAEEDKKDK
jgi:intracellular septation protein